MPKLLGW
jgi:ribonuclease HI